MIASLIKQYCGQQINSPGNSALAKFTSVVDVDQCSVAVQKEFQSRNADLHEERRMVFRIGINLANVIEEGERINGEAQEAPVCREKPHTNGGVLWVKTS